MRHLTKGGRQGVQNDGQTLPVPICDFKVIDNSETV